MYWGISNSFVLVYQPDMTQQKQTFNAYISEANKLYLATACVPASDMQERQEYGAKKVFECEKQLQPVMSLEAENPLEAWKSVHQMAEDGRLQCSLRAKGHRNVRLPSPQHLQL